MLKLLFYDYLFYAIIALLLIVVGLIVGKKKKLTKNKRLVVYTILSMLVLFLPALLGLLDYSFMPYAYIPLAVAYFLLGWYNDQALPWVYNKEIRYRTKFGYEIYQLALAMSLFALLFNVCSEFKYGLWAATSMLPFILASLLRRSYELFVYIPTPIFSVWEYDLAEGYSAPEDIDHSKLMVVSVELFKRENDVEPIRINAKAPDTMLVGDWVKLLFEDYNKKSAHSPIDVYTEGEGGWIFYLKRSFLSPRRYLDYDKTVKQNKIKENNLIVAKRVRSSEES